MYTRVQTGLERLVAAPLASVTAKRLGLLCNPASIDRNYHHARDLIQQRFPGQLRAIFSPQHGFNAEKQDNMIESGDMRDPITGLPVFSLYGATRIPTPDMYALIDLLIVDLQDVGTRVYTFIYTMAHCLEVAREMNKHVLVLDRPNPIGGHQVEGNLLTTEYASFVGRYPIPMRHGLTIGELARLFNDYFKIGAALEVLPMQGWRREMHFSDTQLPWVAPSPNMPTPATALVYPGQVIWEATNISEGRGTTQPFEIFGAPFINPSAILKVLKPADLAGAVLRPVAFEPTSNKWQGDVCHGFQIHVTDPSLFRPYRLALRLLQVIIALYPEAFKWKAPPYEYEYEKQPIDLIIGNKTFREQIQAQMDLNVLFDSWQGQLDEYLQVSREFRLYE